MGIKGNNIIMLALMWEVNMLNSLSDILKVVLQLAQVVALIYAGYKFTQKPHDTLESRHDALEKHVVEQDLKIKDIEKSLDVSHEKHREQDRTNKVFKKIFLLLANFEVAYCTQTGFENTDDLEQAKKELEDYLTGV
jgi:hypothetical protein